MAAPTRSDRRTGLRLQIGTVGADEIHEVANLQHVLALKLDGERAGTLNVVEVGQNLCRHVVFEADVEGDGRLTT